MTNETMIGGYYRVVREGDHIAVYRFKEHVKNFKTWTEAMTWADKEYEEDYWTAYEEE